MAKKIKLVPLTKKDLAGKTLAQREALKGAAKLVIKKAKAAKAALAKGVTLTDIAKAHKPMKAKDLVPPPSLLPAIMKAGIRKIVKDAVEKDAEAAAAWVDADQQLKPEPKPKSKAKAAHPPSAVPVESERPGIARNPKPPKVVKPLTADGTIVPLEIISYHFLKLMERMAAEHGGTSAQALVDLKADIAKGKS